MVGMSAPYNAPSPYQTPEPKRRKPWTAIIGLLLSLIALALLAIGGWQTYTSVTDISGAERYTGSHTVSMEAGETQMVWASSSDVRCEASGPQGAVQDSSPGDFSVEVNGERLEQVMMVQATEAGDYTIACNGEFVLGDGISVGGSLLMLAGGALCCLGFVVMVIGLIIWLVRRNKR